MPVFRFGKPHWHGAFQRPVTSHRTTLAGDDQNVAEAALMGSHQKIKKHRMGLALKHAVQIDARLKWQPATGQLAFDRFFQGAVNALSIMVRQR